MSADEEAFEPMRLRDDPSEPSSLRDAIVGEQAFRADYDESKGLERFRASIAAAAPAPELSATSEPSGIGGGRSWASSAPRLVGVAALITGVSIGLTWLGSDDTPAPPIEPRAAAVSAPEMPEQAPSPSVPTLAVESLPTAEPLPIVEPAPAATAPPTAARKVRTQGAAGATPAASESASSAPDPLEETRHLGALRQVAASAPHRALSMVDEGNRRFAGGSFREEREAIAIDALARLGRRGEAKRAAEAFVATYPTSPFAPSVRRAAGLDDGDRLH